LTIYSDQLISWNISVQFRILRQITISCMRKYYVIEITAESSIDIKQHIPKIF